VEAPTLVEMQEILDLAHLANQGLKSFPVGGLTKTLNKAAQWLADLKAVESKPDAPARYAVDAAEGLIPGFEAMLAVSTSHITPDTAKMLTTGTSPLVVYDHGTYGWCISVPTAEDYWDGHVADATNGDLPVELFLLMTHARDLGCAWLLLDADATVLADAPTFDW